MKILRINGHCVDSFDATLLSENGRAVNYDGYVPGGIGIGGGDDICMDIDIETGKILNWKPLTEEEIVKEFYINNGESVHICEPITRKK